MNYPIFKVIVCGDAKVGKTQLINRLVIKDFEKKYIPTLGCEVFPTVISTREEDDSPKVKLNIWECSGSHEGLGDGYFVGAQGAIIVYDAQAPNLRNITKKIREIRRVCEKIPIFVLGNKCEGEYFVPQESDEAKDFYSISHVSAKENKRVEEAFAYLAREMMG